MLATTRTFLGKKADRSNLQRKWQSYSKSAYPYFPGHVERAAQHQHVEHVARKTNLPYSEAWRRSYTDTSWMREANARFGEHSDDNFASQGSYRRMSKTQELSTLQSGSLGDDQPLSTSPDYGYSPIDVAAHGRLGVHQRVEPPAPYGKQISRRMAEGRQWPSILGTPDRNMDAPRYFVHFDNMSPSEKQFSTECEYWIRRNLKAIPGHLSDRIDFSQLIIQRCYVTKRCKKLFVVWSTVSGPARLEIEPLLVQLVPWVIRTIKRRIKNVPNIPRVFWVYDSGAIPTQMPNKLMHQVRAVHANNAATIDERIDYLKQLDSMDHRLRGVPWFMPYLWAKQSKVDSSKQLQTDFVAAQAIRDKEKQKRESGGRSPNFVN